MNQFDIESKIYVMPTKGRKLLRIFLNIILVVYTLLTLFIIIMDGFSFSKIGELCVAFLIVTYFNARNKPSFQFSILHMEVFNDRIGLLYNAVKMGMRTGVIRYEIMASDVWRIEYSKQQNAIRVFGKMTKIIDQKRENVNEVVIYCREEAYRIIDSIESNFNCKVTCLKE